MDVRLPDGTIIRNVPDGTTRAQLMEKLQANGYQIGPQAAPQQAMDPTDGMSVFDKLAAGVGKSIADTGRGIGQMVGLVPQEEIDQAATRDKALMSTGAGLTGNVLGQVAQMAVPGAAVSKAVPAVKALMAARPVATSAATAAGFAAAQPVVTGDTRLGNAAEGAAASLAGSGVAKVAGRAAKGLSDKISPEVAAMARKAQSLGIPVNMAQLSDSKFVKTLASAVEKMPLTGGVSARNAQQTAFNRATAKEMGESADKITPAVYDSAKSRIGAEFNRLSASNNLKLDNTALASLASVVDESRRFASDDTAKAVASSIDELLGKVDANGLIPGKAYQALDSKLGKLMKSGGEKAHYLGQVREAVRTAMDQSISAADQAAWGTARSQYRALKTVRDLVAKDPSGNISPALLAGRVGSSNAGKEALASGGGGNLADIARVGRQFVRDPIPDSGTAQRLMALGALGGGGSLLGVDPTALLVTLGSGATLGRGANALLNSPWSGRYALDGGNKLVQLLASGARPAPLLLPAAVNALQQ